jgi:CelD/BcsL family acetyltransferase involved in cellulose biosynthesis
MEWLGYGGPVAGLLQEAAADKEQVLAVFDVWERGLLRRQSDGGEGYWLRNIGKNRRRTIRQHHQHLSAALGASPCFRVRTDAAAAEAFLRLEASGWKGKRAGGLALWRRSATTGFFQEVCRRHLESGRMFFFSLEAAEEPIAMICCLRAGQGLFAYRTAYDEELARFGPGVGVFLEAMEHFHRATDAAWFDTCSTRDNEHMLGLFPDRRCLATVMFRVPGSAV